MDFIDQLQQFVKKISGFKDSITTEEATKTSVILPFFHLLGYDIFDPTEFVPEFVADVGIKRGEKVDYAILQDGKPIIIIEAKAMGRNLEKHDSQLFRYFSTTSAKFAILTNGIRYRFYTDLEEANLMDSLPFLDIDLLHLRDAQIEELKKFKKENFSVARIFDAASVLKYAGKFKATLSEQFENPSDEFVRFFLQDVYDGRMTHSVVEKFRPILKASMQEFISETMNDKIKSALSTANAAPVAPAAPASKAPAPVPAAAPAEEEPAPVVESAPAPTEEEMNAYYELQNLLKDDVSLDSITYKKTDSYFAILYQNNTRKWLCRLVLSDNQKLVYLPDADKNPIRRQVANIYELASYRRYITSVIARYGGTLLRPLEREDPPIYQIILKRRFPKRQRV